MATLTCCCKKTSFTFASDRPRNALECCCCDCSNGLNWCSQQRLLAAVKSNNNNNNTTAATTTITTTTTSNSSASSVPQLLHYIDNDITSIKGEEFLSTMKLRPKGATTRIYCNQCYTHLIAIHPLYFSNRVMIITGAFDSASNNTEEEECWKYSGEPIQPEMRIQTKFCTGNEEPFVHGPSWKCDNALWPMQSGLLKKFAFPPCPTPRRGESVQQILQRLPPPVIANVDERPLNGHMTVGVSWLTVTIKNPFVASKEEEDKPNNNKNNNKKKKAGINFLTALAVTAVILATITAIHGNDNPLFPVVPSVVNATNFGVQDAAAAGLLFGKNLLSQFLSSLGMMMTDGAATFSTTSE